MSIINHLLTNSAMPWNWLHKTVSLFCDYGRRCPRASVQKVAVLIKSKFLWSKETYSQMESDIIALSLRVEDKRSRLWSAILRIVNGSFKIQIENLVYIDSILFDGFLVPGFLPSLLLFLPFFLILPPPPQKKTFVDFRRGLFKNFRSSSPLLTDYFTQEIYDYWHNTIFQTISFNFDKPVYIWIMLICYWA